MSRWGWNRSGQDVSVFRAAGVVRVPGESDPLTVSLSISATHVLMTSEGAELGSWALSDVRISRIDPFSFAFVAEGDRVVFVPDDAKSFAAHPAVGAETARAGTGSRLKVKDRLTVRRKAPTQRTASKGGASGAPRRSKSTENDAGSRSTRREKSKPQRRVKRAEASSNDVGRTGLWLKVIDSARYNGWFGLDRVPVHLDQRGKDHQHTFDHGAAATTGLGRRVCTVCGKVRFRA